MSSQIKQLQEELADLRREVAELRQFVRLIPANPETGEPASAQFRCSSLVLISREAQPKIQGVLGSSTEGGQFALLNHAGRPRLQLAGSGLILRADDGQPALALDNGDSSGMGRVVAYDKGSPRAVLKAISGGGCVSVLHDDGRPRASLLSTEHDGADLLMITPDLKPGVRISSGAPNGGMISVHRTNGSPAVTLMCSQQSAGVAIRKADGKTRIVS